MKKITHIFFVCVLLLIVHASQVVAEPVVFVTLGPQKFFVECISQGQVLVQVMVEPGANPHVYEPKPRQMQALSTASLYFSIGDSFDLAWLPRLQAANPRMRVVQTDKGCAKISMIAHEHEGVGSDHSHEHGLDPHIWLDPALVKIQARHIADALMQADPDNAALYRANTVDFMAELDQLDQELREILGGLPPDQRSFLVFHPSWGYFAKAYGLEQMAIETEGKEPSAKDIRQIISLAREKKIRVIFVQPQFSEKSAGVLAKEIGAQVVRLDPLAQDWAENLRQAARAFATVLQ